MTMMLNNIPKKQVPHLLALFNNLSFVGPNSVSVYDEKDEFLSGFEESINEANAYMRGEIKLRSAWDVLDEL